ncbi:zinc finger protein 32-like [Sycon ciliatum]|uniref:zinc finger protein 32-like n=1 Tax=Sycon ciliatum TaxID=27933 RepID=UPI0031F5F728
MEDGEESMSDCSVDSDELPPMPPLIRINRSLSVSGNSSEYCTISAQTSSDSPITGVDQRMQNTVIKVLPDLDPEDTLSFNKEYTSGSPPVPPLTRPTKKGSSSANSLDHYGLCVSSPSKRGQVWHDEKKDARPGQSFELRYGDDSPSKYSGNAEPELPGQPVMKSTASTSFSSYPFDHGRHSETGKRETSEEGDAADIQGVRGYDIRHQPVRSRCAAMVSDQGKRSMCKTLHKCRECPRQFKKASNLRRHERVHTGERPFKCDVCSKSFSQSGNLLMHKRIHTGEKPFICKVCKASFTRSSALRVHERMHTGERPYKCDTCDAAFRSTSNLHVHERIHTGERPYQCDTCDAAFTDSSTLRVHKRIHTGERPYKCDTCDAAFRSTSNLHVHERSHTR